MTLKELCTKSKLTFLEISKSTGISTVYLSQLNTGFKRNPSIGIVSKISNVLKVSLEEVQKTIKS